MNTINQLKQSRERELIVITALVAFTGIIVISLATAKLDIYLLVALGGLIALWFIAHIFIRRTMHGDELLLPLALLLSSIGLIFIYRLKPNLALVQLLWNAIGLLAFMASCFFFRRLERLVDYQYLIGLLGIGLLLSAILFGVDIGGNKNWVIFGPIRFQPSEFAKLFVVLFLAAYLTERREVLIYTTHRFGPFSLPQPRFAAPLLTLWGLTMLMLVFQRDLGSALLYFATTLAMVYVASGRLSYIFLGLTLFVIGATVCYILYPHVQVRVDIWLNPWADPTGKAFQIVQSLFALGSGGVLGSGLTYGFPGFIPEVHTDFIFSAIGEELGLLGSTAILFAYMLLLIRAFRIALQTTIPFRQMAVGGLAIFLSLQVLLIVGGVTKFLPLTGVTLPFVSYGGSSLVSSYIILGVIFAVSESGDQHE